MEDGMEKL